VVWKWKLLIFDGANTWFILKDFVQCVLGIEETESDGKSTQFLIVGDSKRPFANE
jgi:hypothetical protein